MRCHKCGTKPVGVESWLGVLCKNCHPYGGGLNIIEHDHKYTSCNDCGVVLKFDYLGDKKRGLCWDCKGWKD